jgi:hypothetical protein
MLSMMHLRLFASLSLLLSLLAACGGGGAPAEEADAFHTGKTCAAANAVCGEATCSVDIDNRCQTPVTCQLRVDSLCQTTAGEQGPAAASSEQLTILSGKQQRLTAATSCGAGVAVTTMVDEVACF